MTTRSMRCATSVYAVLLGMFSVCGMTSNNVEAQTFLGIRLGEPMEQQLKECPAGDLQWTNSDKPCWRRVSQHVRTVAMPRALQKVAATLAVRHITEADGRVVEVEVEFRPEEAAGVERYLQATLGKPAETEVYERHSRVRGLSKHRAISWKLGGMTVHLLELAASDNGSARAFLDSWAEAQATRERERKARETRAIEERSRALGERQSSPIAALDRALLRKDAGEVKALLAKRIDLSAAPSDGTTVLHTAAVVWGDVNILKQLVDAGAPVNALDDAGQTPLAAALVGAHYRSEQDGKARLITLFDFFMSRKADLRTKDRKGRTLITAAFSTPEMMPVVDHMLRKGVPLPADGLLAALESGVVDDEFKRYPELIDKVDRQHVTARNSAGETALHLAAHSARTIVLMGGLLNFGVDIEARTEEGRTAFSEACFYNNVAAMDLLAKHGADVRVKAKDGGTALHIAASFARAGQIRWLVERGLDPGARDQDGRRPLELALKSERFATRSDAEKLEVLTLLGGSPRDLPPRRR